VSDLGHHHICTTNFKGTVKPTLPVLFIYLSFLHVYISCASFQGYMCCVLVDSHNTARQKPTTLGLMATSSSHHYMAIFFMCYKWFIFLALTLAFSLNPKGTHYMDKSLLETSVYPFDMRPATMHRAYDISLPDQHSVDIYVSDEALKMLGQTLNSDIMKKVRYSDGTFHYDIGLNIASYCVISNVYIGDFQKVITHIFCALIELFMYIRLFQFFDLYTKATTGQISPIKTSLYILLVYHIAFKCCTHCLSPHSYLIKSSINQRLAKHHGYMAHLSWSCVCSKCHQSNE
jgi:hypothetical protein